MPPEETTDSIVIEEPDGFEADRQLDSQGRFYIGRDHAKRRLKVVWKFLDEPDDEPED